MNENYLRVPYGLSVHAEEELQAVTDVLQTSTQMGSRTQDLEERVSKLFSKDYGVMVNSGSSALYVGMETLGLKEGSEVITPVLTFATTVGCIVKNNLIPAFVDVEPDTFCIDANKIEEKISSNTAAICAPDLMGNICNWNEISQLAEKYKLKIIHDSADCLGSTLNNESTGKFSDFSITSFYGSHIINGAGNGGMIVSSDENFVDDCKLLRSWGRSSSLFQESESIENRFNVYLDNIQYDAKFVFEKIGYQLEPTEISAAFALIQLNKLEANLKERQANFELLTNFFSDYGEYFTLPRENESCSTGWLAYPLILKEGAPFSRTDMQIFLENRNIQTRVVFTGNILRQPGFKDINCIGSADEFINADNVMRNGVLLACHHGLTDEMKDHLFQSIIEFVNSF